MKNLNKEVLKYFYQKSLKHKWIFFWAITFLILGMIFNNLCIPLMYKKLVDSVSSGSTINTEAYQASFSIILNILFIALFQQTVVWRIRNILANTFRSKTMKDINDDCFAKIHSHSYAFLSDNFVGALVTKTNRFITSFDTLANLIFYNFGKGFVSLLIATGILFFVSPVFSIILIVWFILFLSVNILFSRWKMKYDIKAASLDSEVSAQMADTFTNALPIKLFSHFSFEMKKFFGLTKEKQSSQLIAWNLNQVFDFISGLFLGIAEFLLLSFALKMYFAGTITVGTIVLIITLMASILLYFWSFGEDIKQMFNALAEAHDMMEILLLPPSIQDALQREKSQIKDGNILFKNVFFSYHEAGEKLFENISLSIPAGQKVGLVGLSGAGKTTFTKLLLRFYDVNKGEVLIDNQNIQNIPQEDLRSAIAFVPQEPVLFHRDLAENIGYGKEDASYEEIQSAAKLAYAHDFISKLPQKYDTLVGERGVKLSGGERQRVAIARAMLKDAPIVILDEATSSLDSESEKFIQKSIHNLIEKKTALIIAHRLSTIKEVDRILVFKEGEIIEDGTFNELIAKKGEFAKLWKLQKLD